MGKHALIVEDELLIGLGMQAMLEPFGFDSFAFASTGAQAMEQLRLAPPDLVTLDLGLLHGDGASVAHAIAAERPGLPVIFVTGDADAARELPGAVVVEKPVAEGDFARAMARAGVAV